MWLALSWLAVLTVNQSWSVKREIMRRSVSACLASVWCRIKILLLLPLLVPSDIVRLLLSWQLLEPVLRLFLRLLLASGRQRIEIPLLLQNDLVEDFHW